MNRLGIVCFKTITIVNSEATKIPGILTRN